MSLFIALSDGIFVYINYRSAKEALTFSLENRGTEYTQAFQLTLMEIEKTMSLMATYIANDPRVRELFHQGVEAVNSEGGAKGGAEAAKRRAELFALVQPSWQQVTQQYKVRQLHFHMGPGSQSFLRVHKPNRFGDNMDQCRYTVVNVNQNLLPVTGFETGRIISGIRGVVPMFFEDPVTKERIHTGALEAGTSFSTLLPELSRTMQGGLAVVLTAEHVSQNIWPEMMARAFQDTTEREGFYLEASSGPAKDQLLELGLMRSLFQTPGTRLVELDGVPYALTGFHLDDFHSASQPGHPPAGMVLVWVQASTEVAAFDQAVWTNIFYAMLGFCIVEILLFLAVHFITRHLENTIRTRTRQLHAAQDKLVDNARQVGMASVATDVLHNVGNVLNSVNIGAGQLRENVRTSQVDNVQKVAALMHDHRHSLDEYLTQDPKGAKVPRYLDHLAVRLGEEKTENLASIGQLQDHIEHISRVINSQQDRCRGGSLREEVNLRSLLEKALEINESCIENYDIEVVVKAENLPAIQLDKHRALQVLVNLIRNAAQALSHPDLHARQMEVSANLNPNGEVTLSVQDTGIGIESANLDQIFTHGYTTKENGHGFGLHGAANSAGEMGGTLQAFSEGKGSGARFVLTIPLEEQRISHGV